MYDTDNLINNFSTMKDKIKRIAETLGLQEKEVAKIFKEGFVFWLDARFQDLNISGIRNELDSIIYE